MKHIYTHYKADEAIPVKSHVKNKKMVKYYNREAQAALVSVNKLFDNKVPNTEIPIFYAVGVIEHSEFDIKKVASNSIDDNGNFNNEAFIEKGMMQISPLTQFKVLYNMTLCFISIEYGITGDNAVVYSSAEGLINNALYANEENEVLIGAGKLYEDGSVSSGFALISKNELEELPTFDSDTEAIEIFKYLQNNN